MTLKNDFKNQNFDKFAMVVHNFGKSDDDIIFNRHIHFFMHNLDKKILDSP